MLQSIEGIYKNGKIDLTEKPVDIDESRVIVTFLEDKSTLKAKKTIYFGMFAGSNRSTEEDFKIAEFQPNLENYLD